MAITNGYTSLAKVKALTLPLAAADAADDAVLEDLVTQASRAIDSFTGRTFYARSEEHTYDAPVGLRSLFIDDDDLLTVTKLTNGDGSEITNTQYQLRPLNRNPKWEICILPSAGIAWEPTADGDREGAITVEGTWGFTAATPADIEQACQEMVVASYRRRYGNNQDGNTQVTASGLVITPAGIPKAAAEILGRYKRLV